jgi:hypothetical protein
MERGSCGKIWDFSKVTKEDFLLLQERFANMFHTSAVPPIIMMFYNCITSIFEPEWFFSGNGWSIVLRSLCIHLIYLDPSKKISMKDIYFPN